MFDRPTGFQTAILRETRTSLRPLLRANTYSHTHTHTLPTKKTYTQIDYMLTDQFSFEIAFVQNARTVLNFHSLKFQIFTTDNY